MDPIRPIGPVERDLEPVVRVTRSSPDGRKQQQQQPEQHRKEPQESPPVAPKDDPGNNGSLVDVRV